MISQISEDECSLRISHNWWQFESWLSLIEAKTNLTLLSQKLLFKHLSIFLINVLFLSTMAHAWAVGTTWHNLIDSCFLLSFDQFGFCRIILALEDVPFWIPESFRCFQYQVMRGTNSRWRRWNVFCRFFLQTYPLSSFCFFFLVLFYFLLVFLFFSFLYQFFSFLYQ